MAYFPVIACTLASMRSIAFLAVAKKTPDDYLLGLGFGFFSGYIRDTCGYDSGFVSLILAPRAFVEYVIVGGFEYHKVVGSQCPSGKPSLAGLDRGLGLGQIGIASTGTGEAWRHARPK